MVSFFNTSTDIDELFDFDETIPHISVESEATPSQCVKSPLFAPPLSPFRPRSMEKYNLPGGDEDPFDDSSVVPTETTSTLSSPQLSSSMPIAITPPSRSFLAAGLGLDEDEDDGTMQGLIRRISLKNTRSGPGSFAEQRMLWDIPGDHYRSLPS